MGDFLDIFALNLDHDDEEYEHGGEDGDEDGEGAVKHQKQPSVSFPYVHTLSDALYHLAQPMPMPMPQEVEDEVEEEEEEEGAEEDAEASHMHLPYCSFLTNIVQNHMGSMAQCRIGSTEIREGNGIISLMTVLYNMVHIYLPQLDKQGQVQAQAQVQSQEHPNDTNEQHENENVKEIYYGLTIAVLGALRDLACGNAQNRLQIGQFQFQREQGREGEMNINEDLDVQQKQGEKEEEEVAQKPSQPSDDSSEVKVKVKVRSKLQRSTSGDGIHILSYFIKKYDADSPSSSNSYSHSWEDISTSKLELKAMTNALGVIRNISHSTPSNCLALHQAGMTSCLIKRLLISSGSNSGACSSTGGNNDEKMTENNGESGGTSTNASTNTNTNTSGKMYALPDVTKPWREACYRIAGSLINMAERCHDVAVECAKDEALIWILIQSWGGFEFEFGDKGGGEGGRKSNFGKKGYPVLHIGLGNVLNEKIKLEELEASVERTTNTAASISTSKSSADDSHLTSDTGSADGSEKTSMSLMDVIQTIREREEKRKRSAQEREIARKKAMKK